MSAVLTLTAGFLLAVLWFDLMFDVQVLGRRPVGEPLAEPVLASIAAYYRHATTSARPMSYLIGLVMLVTMGGTLIQVFVGRGPVAIRLAALALCGVPIVTARVRTLPHAVRLGARTDSVEVQSALARAICRDPAHHPARVLHHDRVPCRVIPEGDLVRWPRARDARIEMERGAAQPEPEDRLDRGAVHPPGRPRVPGPSPAPHVRRLGIDVGGDHVRLDLVPVDARARARAVDGVEDREELPRPVAVAERGEGHHRPHGRMGALPAVLPYARRVARDVAGIERRAVERRREEQDELLSAANEVLLDRGHRPRCARGVGGRRKRGARPPDRIGSGL